ncbi:hypothetical protein HMPREF9442_01645 [Paraprevotella xylaniphila YIT 11841]|uniref:Uncharacterized protein n=1 Tax=Paraprevotella xylaniphila YIT 11841 TaxID=762982 RepID=F3QTX6_9BACT|nr:hypothetical protein HMPREF9442_01645 [Paraprevotella xylaniphila YIT 11841]
MIFGSQPKRLKRTFGCIPDEAGWRGAGRRQAENEEQDKR